MKQKWLSLLLVPAMLLSLAVFCSATENPVTWETLIQLNTVGQLEDTLGTVYQFELVPNGSSVNALYGDTVAFTASVEDGNRLSGTVTVRTTAIPLTEDLTFFMTYDQLVQAGKNSGFATAEQKLPANGGPVVYTLTLDRPDLCIELRFQTFSEGDPETDLHSARPSEAEILRKNDTSAGLHLPMPFIDVAPTAWYANAVKYVYIRGLMTGVAEDAFFPDGTTTRGMIVTILHNLEGHPEADPSRFKDVRASDWFAEPVAWAAEEGIVTGYDSTHFGPNDLITREQMAVILHRYARYKGYKTSMRADLSGFTDSGSISNYAVSAIRWANAVGLINGATASTLAPRGNATRAQTATIFMRFLEDVAA